ncbi:hypothetical protein DYD21_10475 [Rhodohalobacter sp. SW132]|uniref:carboxylate--amine ligase n=1 Tax=Rhodohalobacter sp. SW132 TaxID=2293433 RepID=UPI000E21EAAE|nr:hypothetical protein [Rhodohalobacter sp. SW132]REL33821.1 hypothetical protein DYD21_10475 [Rhodohalobacter sp. SW132]
MKFDVIVTDCETKHGYEIAKSLAERGLKVKAHFNKKLTPFYFSRILRHKVCFQFKAVIDVDRLVGQLEKDQPDVLIPVSNKSVYLVSENREILTTKTRFLLPEKEKVRLAQNKRKTFKYAESINILCPKTIYDTSDDLSKISERLSELSFPVVLKFVNVGETGVKYCNSLKEVEEILTGYGYKEGNIQPPVIQEYILGHGVGYYGLYKNGECIYDYTHRRIHEYPVTGGSSTFAVSTNNKELKKIGRKILTSLEWNGVAMIEFKETAEGELVLMEINPKFWGSYALSEKIGLSIAWDYYNLAKGKKVETKEYKSGIAYKWIFNDWLYQRDTLLSKKNIAKIDGDIVKVIHNDISQKDIIVTFLKSIDGFVRLITKKINPHSISS